MKQKIDTGISFKPLPLGSGRFSQNHREIPVPKTSNKPAIKSGSKTQKVFDIYYLLIGIIYLVISWTIFSKWGLLMSLFFIIIALSFIRASFFKKKNKNQGSKFILFSYLFVMLSMLFPFTMSIYRKDIYEAIFVFLMGAVFFILYLREVKSIEKSKWHTNAAM